MQLKCTAYELILHASFKVILKLHSHYPCITSIIPLLKTIIKCSFEIKKKYDSSLHCIAKDKNAVIQKKWGALDIYKCWVHVERKIFIAVDIIQYSTCKEWILSADYK